jgi:alpha-beta hydrolase superfamily lysophospholipase
MTAKLPIVDPVKVHPPVLVVRGGNDGIATEVDLMNFCKQLAYADRQFVILPGAAHALSLGINRQQFWHVMRAFLELPPRQDNLKTS